MIPRSLTYLDELCLPGVCERRVQLLVLLYSVLRVQGVDAQVAQCSAKVVLLRAVLEQRGLQRGGCHLCNNSIGLPLIRQQALQNWNSFVGYMYKGIERGSGLGGQIAKLSERTHVPARRWRWPSRSSRAAPRTGPPSACTCSPPSCSPRPETIRILTTENVTRSLDLPCRSLLPARSAASPSPGR